MSQNPAPLSDKGFTSALGLAWDLGYAIALPLVLLALGGRLLDKALGSTPLFMLVGVVLSMVVTSWLVYRKLMPMLHHDKDNKEKGETKKVD